jgi:hypothetical protein
MLFPEMLLPDLSSKGSPAPNSEQSPALAKGSKKAAAPLKFKSPSQLKLDTDFDDLIRRYTEKRGGIH